MAPDTWTSQLFILADYYNVQVQDPDWAEKYTNNQAKYVDQPALTGFQRLQEGFESGWYQEDFGSATFDDGLNMLATGEIAHYPMLSFALSTIAENHPDAIQDIGYFGQPGDDAATNGSTIWMPAGIYIAGTSEHQDVAKEFLGFVASIEGTDAQTAAVAPQGPYLIEGATLPDDTLPAVLDIQAYIDVRSFSTGFGVPVADQRPQPGVPHRRSRLRSDGVPRKQQPCTTRTSLRRLSNSASLVGEPESRICFTKSIV